MSCVNFNSSQIDFPGKEGIRRCENLRTLLFSLFLKEEEHFELQSVQLKVLDCLIACVFTYLYCYMRLKLFLYQQKPKNYN